MYRLWIVEDDMGIAEAIQTQAELWDMQVRCVRNFRNVMGSYRRRSRWFMMSCACCIF